MARTDPHQLFAGLGPHGLEVSTPSEITQTPQAQAQAQSASSGRIPPAPSWPTTPEMRRSFVIPPQLFMEEELSAPQRGTFTASDPSPRTHTQYWGDRPEYAPTNMSERDNRSRYDRAEGDALMDNRYFMARLGDYIQRVVPVPQTTESLLSNCKLEVKVDVSGGALDILVQLIKVRGEKETILLEGTDRVEL